MADVNVGLSVTLEGAFFQRDPAMTVRENIRSFLEKVAEEGQSAVRATFPVGGAGDPHPGAGQAGVIGRVESMTGKRWALHAVISEQFVYPWGAHGATVRSGRKVVASSGQEQYRGGKLEKRLHMFANANRALQSSRALLSTDLSRGLE